MLNVLLIIIALVFISFLFAGGKIRPVRMLKFFAVVLVTAAILVFVNVLSGFALTGVFGILLGVSFLTVIVHCFLEALFREISKGKKNSVGSKKHKKEKRPAA